MAKSNKFSPARLRDALLLDCQTRWDAARAARPDETPYAFFLYGVGDSPYLRPHVLTEEGLTQVAERYIDDGYYDTLPEARAALRYSVEDAPGFFAEVADAAPNADAQIEPHEGDLHEPKALKAVMTAAIEALARLDAAGTFGKGTARKRVMLGVLIEGADDEVSNTSIKKLNPPEVWKRFEKDTTVEGSYQSCDHLAGAPDGKSVYRSGSRERDNPKAREQFVKELAAYQLTRAKFTQQWLLQSENSCRPVAGLVVAADGKSLVVYHGHHQGDDCTSFITRHRTSDGKALAEVSLPGEPCAIALASDDSSLAVSHFTGEVHLLDGELNVARSVKLTKNHASDLQFLASGDLIIGTLKGIFVLGPRDKSPREVAKAPAHTLSVDAGRRLLAATGVYEHVYGDKPPRTSSIELFKLPSFKPAGTIKIAKHQLWRVVLSPDGRVAACSLCDPNRRYRESVALFDVATGAELARRKMKGYAQSMAFLPDSRTVLIGVSAVQTGPPIQVWKPLQHIAL